MMELPKGELTDNPEILRGYALGLEKENARLRAEVTGADERAKLLLDAKNRWADRARLAEAKLARVVEALGGLLDHGDEDGARAALAAAKGE